MTSTRALLAASGLTLSLASTPFAGAALGAGVGATALVPSTLEAQTAQIPSTLVGAWRYAHPDAHGVAIVRAAIEPALAALPSWAQPIARERLETRTRIATRIEIGTEDGRVQVTTHGERDFTVDLALGAAPATLRGPEGRDVQASQALSGGWLQQTFAGPNGGMHVLYSTEPSGEPMHVDVTLSSERLANPIRYRLDYVRVR